MSSEKVIRNDSIVNGVEQVQDLQNNSDRDSESLRVISILERIEQNTSAILKWHNQSTGNTLPGSFLGTTDTQLISKEYQSSIGSVRESRVEKSNDKSNVETSSSHHVEKVFDPTSVNTTNAVNTTNTTSKQEAVGLVDSNHQTDVHQDNGTKTNSSYVSVKKNQVSEGSQPYPKRESDLGSSSETASEKANEKHKEEQREQGLISKITDTFKSITPDLSKEDKEDGGDKAKDAAGGAVGGSLWEAALELKEVADDVGDSSIGKKVKEKLGVSTKDSPSNSDDYDVPTRNESGQFLSREERARIAEKNKYSITDAKQVNGKNDHGLRKPQRDNDENQSSVSIKEPSEYQTNTHLASNENQLNTGSNYENNLHSSENHNEPKSLKSSKERKEEASNDKIESKIDEQTSQAESQHKELIDTIEKKSFSEPGSMMDSALDMLGGGLGGDDVGGGDKKKGKKKGRIRGLIERVKGKKDSSKSKTNPTVKATEKVQKPTKLSKVSQAISKASSSAGQRMSGIGTSIAQNSTVRAAGNVAGKAAAPLAAVTAGYFKYDEIKDREDLTASQKAVQVGSTTTGTMAGAAAGGAAGAAIGSVVPVVGTIVGGLIGAAIGGWLGSSAGDVVGESITDRMEHTDGLTKSERESLSKEEQEKDHVSSSDVSRSQDSNTIDETEKAHAISNSVTKVPSQPSQPDISQQTPTVIKSQRSEEQVTLERSLTKLTKVSPNELQSILPEITHSQLSQQNSSSTSSENEELTAVFDEKKLSKAIADALEDKLSSSNTAMAGMSGGSFGSFRPRSSHQPSHSSNSIPTEFDDTTLTLIAHDRV